MKINHLVAASAAILLVFLILRAGFDGLGRTRVGMVVGVGMVPRGEVGLIFAELGRASGIFNNEVYAAMVIVIALTTLLPPLLMKWIYTRFDPSASGPPGVSVSPAQHSTAANQH